jgi:voltage-gated potassium channel
MDQRAEGIARRFELPMLVVALLVIPVLIVEESSLGDPWAMIASVANWLIWFAFLFEAVVMLSVVPDRWAWIRENPFVLPVVALTPPFAPAGMQAARVFRLFRLLRLARSFRLITRFFSLEGLKWAAVATAFLVVACGTAFEAVEPNSPNNSSPWDGIWWAFTAISTGGFGDIQPETDAGRAIAIFLIIVGVGFIVMLTAAMAQMFVERSVQSDIDEHEDHVLTELRELREQVARLEQKLS